MATISTDLTQLYNRQFGKNPVVPKQEDRTDFGAFLIEASTTSNTTTKGSALTATYRGQEIWLPIKFTNLDVSVYGVSEILLPYAVIGISAKKTFIETPMVERKGNVIEQYNIENFDINVSGFVIGYDNSGKYPIWPETELEVLRKLFELSDSLDLDNALTNIFIGDDQRVVIASLDLPASKAGVKHIVPFTMTIKSDSIFILELE